MGDDTITLTKSGLIKIAIIGVFLLLVLSVLLVYAMTGASPVSVNLQPTNPPINVTIHSAYKTAGIQGFTPKTGGFFVVVNMTVENRGDNDYSFNDNTVSITNGRLSVPQLYEQLQGFRYWDLVPARSSRTREVIFGTDAKTKDFTISFYYNNGKNRFTQDLGTVPVRTDETSSITATPASVPINVTINSAYKTLNIGDSRPYSGKIFVVTNMTIENTGDTDYAFNESSVSITGGGPLTQKLYGVLKNPFYWGPIPAHGTRTGEVVFSILNSTQQCTITFLDENNQTLLRRALGTIPETGGPSA